MRRSARPTLAIPTLTLAALAWLATPIPATAGGETCSKTAQAKQASASDCQADAEECLSAMATKIAAKGWAGFETEKRDHGAYTVVRVAQDSPADAAGFQVGDILVAMNGLDLYAEDKSALKAAKKGLGVGSSVTYKVKRAGGMQKVKVTLSEVPPRIMAQWIGQHMLDQHAHIEVAAAG